MQIKTKIVSCHTADSNQVKQEVNSTAILPPSVFPGVTDSLLQQNSQCAFGFVEGALSLIVDHGFAGAVPGVLQAVDGLLEGVHLSLEVKIG